MRTLLTNLFPPQSVVGQNPSSDLSAKNSRTFPEKPVFASEDEDLLEVGVDETAMAAPSLSPAKERGAGLARGLAIPARNHRSNL